MIEAYWTSRKSEKEKNPGKNRKLLYGVLGGFFGTLNPFWPKWVAPSFLFNILARFADGLLYGIIFFLIEQKNIPNVENTIFYKLLTSEVPEFGKFHFLIFSAPRSSRHRDHRQTPRSHPRWISAHVLLWQGQTPLDLRDRTPGPLFCGGLVDHGYFFLSLFGCSIFNFGAFVNCGRFLVFVCHGFILFLFYKCNVVTGIFEFLRRVVVGYQKIPVKDLLLNFLKEARISFFRAWPTGIFVLFWTEII
jgi:hypothetical protein